MALNLKSVWTLPGCLDVSSKSKGQVTIFFSDQSVCLCGALWEKLNGGA